MLASQLSQPAKTSTSAQQDYDEAEAEELRQLEAIETAAFSSLQHRSMSVVVPAPSHLQGMDAQPQLSGNLRTSQSLYVESQISIERSQPCSQPPHTSRDSSLFIRRLRIQSVSRDNVARKCWVSCLVVSQQSSAYRGGLDDPRWPSKCVLEVTGAWWVLYTCYV